MHAVTLGGYQCLYFNAVCFVLSRIIIGLIRLKSLNRDRGGIHSTKRIRKISEYHSWLDIARIYDQEKALDQRVNQFMQAIHYIVFHSPN
jgi:hypothetical protein